MEPLNETMVSCKGISLILKHSGMDEGGVGVDGGELVSSGCRIPLWIVQFFSIKQSINVAGDTTLGLSKLSRILKIYVELYFASEIFLV